MKGLVLAAGFATRLYPLTRDRAKPLLEVGGEPVLSHVVRRVLAIPNLTEVAVVTNRRFAADFEAWRDAFDASTPISIVEDGAESESDKLGAVADLRLGLRRLAESGPLDDGVLIIAGDNLIEFDLDPFADRFRRAARPLILCRRIEGTVPPGRFGEITVDDDGVVIRFREKPERPESPLAATCIYLFPAAVADELDQYLAGGGDHDAAGHFIAWLAARRPVEAAPFDGVLHDIGNLESLERARREFRG